MAKKQKAGTTQKTLRFRFRKRRIYILLDRVLFLRYFRTLHGRFWGITGISVMLIGFSLCMLIYPEPIDPSTALSDFGAEVRTAPLFAGSVFFAAYGLWRWKKYLSRTWKRTRPVTGLISLTVIGLYLIALMPVSWLPWPYRIHMFGVILAGCSMLTAVILDGLLTKIHLVHNQTAWRLLRYLSIILIVSGGWITFGSTNITGWYSLSFWGEGLLIGGYWLWIAQKTYLGEGNRSALARIARRIVLID